MHILLREMQMIALKFTLWAKHDWTNLILNIQVYNNNKKHMFIIQNVLQNVLSMDLIVLVFHGLLGLVIYNVVICLHSYLFKQIFLKTIIKHI
jgi:hypothetical protein